MSGAKERLGQVAKTFEEEGLYWVWRKGATVVRDGARERLRALSRRVSPGERKRSRNWMVDVMFVNGCHASLPHPIRYRVEHQMEQVEAAGYSCARIEASEVTSETLRHARAFIIFRCPYTDAIGEFINEAKALNKRVLYDIDDLTIHHSYTDEIPYVQGMAPEERALYDDGVARMGKVLGLCEGAITTTEALAGELQKFVPSVFVNRNTASETMVKASQNAMFYRDDLPFLSPEKLGPHERKRQKASQERYEDKRASGAVTIGYFSGSITHNDDFAIVLPALVRLMENHPNVRLLVGGELSLPEELMAFQDRIDSFPFGSWWRLPHRIASCDINIAPLRAALFNEAKSENKWVEASLVGVPTVASDVGAFARMIEDGKTGILCKDDEWYGALEELVTSPEKRAQIGKNAYRYCMEHATTIRTSAHMRRILERTVPRSAAFVLPNLEMSGGVRVVLTHAAILQAHGWDVSVLVIDGEQPWVEHNGHRFPVLNRCTPAFESKNCPIAAHFDVIVATFWDTLDFVRQYPFAKRACYLVQGYETDFYDFEAPLRRRAEATYQDAEGVRYLTISRWCDGWLRSRYGVVSRFAPNGIDLRSFSFADRSFGEGRLRVLVEGNCDSEYKNVDEAFAIVDKLDPSRYEIWYMSNSGETKSHYRIDRNLGSVSPDKVADVYRQCHILLKTSKLESFSYPPLEMMATGGLVVAAPNEGNVEYLEHEGNCLLYEPGNIAEGAAAIERLCGDAALRSRLIEGGIETARRRDWASLEDEVLDLYLEDE